MKHIVDLEYQEYSRKLRDHLRHQQSGLPFWFYGAVAGRLFLVNGTTRERTHLCIVGWARPRGKQTELCYRMGRSLLTALPWPTYVVFGIMLAGVFGLRWLMLPVGALGGGVLYGLTHIAAEAVAWKSPDLPYQLEQFVREGGLDWTRDMAERE